MEEEPGNLASVMIKQSFDILIKKNNWISKYKHSIDPDSPKHITIWIAELTLEGFGAPTETFLGEDFKIIQAKMRAQKSYLQSLPSWEQTLAELLYSEDFIFGEKIKSPETVYLELKGSSNFENKPLPYQSLDGHWFNKEKNKDLNKKS